MTLLDQAKANVPEIRRAVQNGDPYGLSDESREKLDFTLRVLTQEVSRLRGACIEVIEMRGLPERVNTVMGEALDGGE